MEREVVTEAFGKKRILLNDYQRLRLAEKGKPMGRKVLEEISSFFSTNTIFLWHRQLIAQKCKNASAIRTAAFDE